MQNELCLIQTYIIFLKLIYLYVEQFRVFWLAITAPVKQFRSEAEWMSRVRRRSTESATGCEAAGNLPDKIENNTVYYNGAESDYQPDAYGNTRKEKWSKTGLEMSYDYDTLNRLVSVTTPDGKSEHYAYNKNSQVTALSGMFSGKMTYSNARSEKLSLSESGIVRNYAYNEAGLISSLSYTSDTGLQTGFEYLYDSNFNITQRTQLDSGNKDTYEYDAVNRLVESKLQGKFVNDTYEELDLFHMNEISRDIDGMKNGYTLNGQFFPADKVTLDENGKSFVYDFGEQKEIQKIELFKNNLSVSSRVRERDVHVYTKQDEEDGWSELLPAGWKCEVDSRNQSIHFNLKNTLKTRFIKIRTIWDDRDIDNKNVSDYVTFTNDSVQKMIRIWTVQDIRDEDYTYDKNSNRTSLTKDGQIVKYLYYSNANKGNTARVMYDGKWWYAYDKNGNRTARASRAELKNDKVTLDKTCEYWEYAWDYRNRLIKVRQFNAPDNSANVCVEYSYDAQNRRIERISRTESEPETTRYAYGRNGALTYQEKNKANTKSSRTFSYLNDQIICFIDSDSEKTENVRYVVTDIQGSVTEVYDKDNKILWKSDYTAFGIKAVETTDLIDFDGLYTGCDYDAETGLTYHWNRWRSENGANFISEDFARDGLNWYGYAGMNPIMYVDTDGREAGDYFDNPDLAAKDFAMTYNDDSIKNNVELGSFIREKDGKYYYDVPVSSGESKQVKRTRSENDKTIVAGIHTHGKYELSLSNNMTTALEPSLGDIENSNKSKIPEYVVTPDGSMFIYEPPAQNNSNGTIGVFPPIFPSDPGCPSYLRKNDNNAFDKPDNYFIRKE